MVPQARKDARVAPSNKVSGGKMLSSRTRRSGGRAAALLRVAAVTVGRTDTALGAFYRRLSAAYMADGMIKAFNCAIALENLVCDSPKRCRQSSR
jgi:hypothetical protein